MRDRTKQPVCRAALLLEVVIALVIMVSALGVLGAQLTGGLRMTAEADDWTRAAALVDRMLALVELDPDLQELILQEQVLDGEFGDRFPGWFWEIEFQPIEQVPGLGQIRLTILYQEDIENQDNAKGARIIRQVALLKGERAKIDLVEDFGMDEMQVEQLLAAMPTVGFDPSAMDPQVLIMLATQDPEMLLQMLPALAPLLQRYFGAAIAAGELPAGLSGDGGDAGLPPTGGLSPDDLAGLLDGLAGGGGGGAQLPGVGGQPGAGRRGGAAPGAGADTTRRPGARRGGAAPGGTGGGGSTNQPRYTIEDLMRLRDEMGGG
jgi:hypothetical protein